MNVPLAFAERTRTLLGEEAYCNLETALRSEPPVSIRMNVRKCDALPSVHRVPWAFAGVYLSRRPSFTFDPLFHAGCYYVQEASSMFVEQVLRTYVSHPVVMLDLCAAPGGKSTHVRSLLPEGSLLVANEVMRNRSQVLAENLVKWGDAEVIVTNNSPADFGKQGALFDVVLTDVPCSGEGMFRKDEVAIEEWSVNNVANCWQRQRSILTDVWPALKPGGLLIYSTCTYNKEENEENVAWIARELGAEVLEVPCDPAWGVTGNLAGSDFPVYRFLPHRTQGEGFFLAALRKAGGETMETSSVVGASVAKGKARKEKGKGGNKGQVMPPAEVKTWIEQSESFRFEVKGTRLVAFPERHFDVYTQLQSTLQMLSAGIAVAELKGRDWTPHHSLAMSTLLNRSAFPQAELTYEQAIAYLRKEVVVLDATVPRGHVLLTYRHVPLGFAKNIGNRANNLYPQEWRIRSSYVPEAPVQVW